MAKEPTRPPKTIKGHSRYKPAGTKPAPPPAPPRPKDTTDGKQPAAHGEPRELEDIPPMPAQPHWEAASRHAALGSRVDAANAAVGDLEDRTRATTGRLERRIHDLEGALCCLIAALREPPGCFRTLTQMTDHQAQRLSRVLAYQPRLTRRDRYLFANDATKPTDTKTDSDCRCELVADDSADEENGRG